MKVKRKPCDDIIIKKIRILLRNKIRVFKSHNEHPENFLCVFNCFSAVFMLVYLPFMYLNCKLNWISIARTIPTHVNDSS